MTVVATPKPAPSAQVNQAGLRRDIELLEILADIGDPVGVSRLAELAEREKSQVSRALASLHAAGLVERLDGRYRLGSRLFALASRTLPARLAGLGSEHLARLGSRTGETCHLCVLAGDDVLTIASRAGRSAFRALSWEGQVVAAPRLSAGLVLISDLPESVVSARWPDESLADIPGTSRMRSTAALLATLSTVRRDGLCTLVDEPDPGVSGMSAPVRDLTSRIVAAFNVALPTARIAGRRRELAAMLAAQATALSADLGYAPG